MTPTTDITRTYGPRDYPTEVRIDEHGDETHESWLLLTVSRPSSTPGRHLFQSEAAHRHYVEVSIYRCSRRRDLKHDWPHQKKKILEMAMSEAQWSSFVSSNGNGGGVPATLSFINAEDLPQGYVPQAVHTSRLALHHKEVGETAKKALTHLQEAQAAVQDGFDRKAGRVEMRKLLDRLENAMNGVPSNMEYAAKSLAEHAESTTERMRADVEGMVANALRNGVQIEAPHPAGARSRRHHRHRGMTHAHL